MSAVISALSALLGVGLWVWYRAMKRAQRAILASQKQVIDAAQTERDQTDAEIDRLGSRDLAAAVDAAFPGSGTELHPDDANGDR